MIHTYIKHREGFTTTGVWAPKELDGSGPIVFRPLKDFKGPNAEINAAKYASFLNGGDHPNKPWYTGEA